MTKKTAVQLVTAVIALFALGGWALLSPANGSGWLILAAYMVTGALAGNSQHTLKGQPLSFGFITLFFAVVCGVLWLYCSHLWGAGWVGLLGLLTCGQALKELYASAYDQ